MISLFAGLRDYWPLHESSGTRRSVTGLNPLADNNTVTGNPGVARLASQFVNANSEYLSIATNGLVEFGDASFTIACWVYLDNKTTFQAIVSKNDNSSQRDYELAYSLSADTFRFTAFRPTDSTQSADWGSAPTASVWYFLCGWHDAGADTVNIQVNSDAPISQATGGALQAANTADFVVGGRDGSDYLDGRVCDVGLWARVLQSHERAWLYNYGRGRTWPFDGTPSPLLLDAHRRRTRVV